MISIKILEIRSPSHFFCREIDSELSSEEHHKYLQLQVEINEIFNEEQAVQIPHIPCKDEICLGYRQSDKTWYRVKNEGVYARKYGQEAFCFLVDVGETESISIRWLRKCPKRYLELPFQIKECCVFGVKALTLEIKEDMSVAQTSCVRWDDSATTFMEKCVKRSVSASAEVLYTDSKGRLRIKLYLNDGKETYNFNDLLVRNEFGVYDETDGQMSPNKQKTTMTRNTKHLQRLLAQSKMDYHSDSEILQELKISSIYSDNEDGNITKTKSPEYMSDSNCISDRVLITDVNSTVHKGRGYTSHVRTLDFECAKQTQSFGNVGFSHCRTVSQASQLNSTSDSESYEIPPWGSESSKSLAAYGVRVKGGPLLKSPQRTEDIESHKPALKHSTTSYLNKKLKDSSFHQQHGYTSESGRKSEHMLSNRNFNVTQNVHTSFSDTESFSRGRALSVSPQALSRGRSPPVPLPPHPSLSRGRCQLELLKQAMKSQLPASPSSTSDIDSDSPSPVLNMTLINELKQSQKNISSETNSNVGASLSVNNNSRQVELSLTNQNRSSHDFGGARPKISSVVPGQFDDSESDSHPCPLPKKGHGLSVGSLLSSDPNVPLTRASLPKAARSKTSKTGIHSDSSDVMSLLSGRGSAASPRSNRCSAIQNIPSKQVLEEEKRRIDMISKQQGHQLLSILKPSHSSQGVLAGVALLSQPTVRMDNLDNVLVHSHDTIKPITDVKDAPIGRLMKQAMHMKEITVPRLIQAYGWKCIMRGLNFVGLSPPGTGKTYAYLVPIISQIVCSGRYSSLPKGSGPYAIILLPSWKSVRKIYAEALSLIQLEKKPKILDLYGSGEDLKMCPLINGCEILIATPPSLKRVLDLQYVHLNRLCHLVVDDAEITLVDFKMEVRDIISNYVGEISKQDERTAPQQILIFGSKWEKLVSNFVKSYMNEPTIAIASRYEASCYGRVRQIPKVCRKTQKPNVFLGILDEVVKENCKLIIFASTVRLALDVHKLLQSSSLFALVAHDDMDKFNIEEQSSNWHCCEGEEPSILVATDQIIPQLCINNATSIIHYDISESKTKFGNRMSCMSHHYWNFLQQEQTVEPTSYILITEDSTDSIDTIGKLLIRSKVDLPRALTDMMAGRKQARNLDIEKRFCKYLKAFGKCRHEEICTHRHLVIPEVDGRMRFTSGYVKIRISNVADASHYSGIVLEHKTPEGEVTDYGCDYTGLMFQMQSFYGNPVNRRRHTNMCPGDICAYEYNEIFHRVKILDLTNMNTCDGSIKAEVQFVDDGCVEEVEAKKLFDLPQKLKLIPFQAVDVYICRVKPIDSDEEWVPRASMYMHRLIERKELKGRIVLGMDNTLWLDPLVEELELSAVHTRVRKMNVRAELLKNGFADDNPKHLDKLYEICSGRISIPDINRESQRKEQTLGVEILSENFTYHEVYVSAVDLPNLIFVMRKDTYIKLERMMDSLNNLMGRSEENRPFIETDFIDCVCAAKFPEDNRWYRVRIMEEVDGQVNVFYGDYGDKRTISKDELFQLPDDYWELPFQAIECQMAYIQPRGDEWDEDSGDLLWDLTHMVNDDKKLVIAKIISKSQAVYAGLHRYEVEIFDTETNDDVNLSQELVWSGVASPKPDSPLQEMCQVPQLVRKTYKTAVLKIPDLCAVIYWEKITERAKSAPKEIYKIVEQSVTNASTQLELVGYKALASIIKLIGRMSDPVSHQLMLECLFCSARASQRLEEEIIEQECGTGITKCLEQNCRPDIQVQAVIAIDKFLEISHKFFSVFGNKRIIEILCQFLEVCEVNQTLVEIYTALTSLCIVTSKICDWAYSFQVCTTAQQHLEQISDVLVVEACLKYLVKLMTMSPDPLRKEKLIRCIVSVMDKTSSDKCIQYGVQLCENYCHENRKHKTVLLELGLVVILNRLLDSSNIKQTTRSQCQSLHQSLAVKVPQVTSINNRPTSHRHDNVGNSEKVAVLWVQNVFRVIITVKMRGINTCDVQYTPHSVELRATYGNRETLGLSYELFSEIDTSKCRHEVKTNKARISLRKLEKGTWSRLLKTKDKVPNLSLDFQKFIDSSSDSDVEVCDDDRPFLLKKKKKKQLPKNMKKPKTKTGFYNDESSETTSTESDEEVRFKTSADFNPYDIFD